MTRQLALPISPPPEPTLENFVPGANARTARAPARAARRGARRVGALPVGRAGQRAQPPARGAARGPGSSVADDVERLDERPADRRCSTRINAAREPARRCSPRATRPPAQLALREDLKSRLAWGLVYQVKPLSDAEKALTLHAEAARRGLQLSDEVVWYLLTHVRRDLPSLIATARRSSTAPRSSSAAPSRCRWCASCCAAWSDAEPVTLGLFDLDNTLLAGDSDYEWGQFLVDRGVLGARRVRGAERGLLRAVQGGHAGHPRVPRLRAAPARRARAAGPRALARRVHARAHPADDHAAARALVRRHLEAGDLCAIVTATNSFVTAPIAREFGVPHLIATEPEAQAGRFTGRVAGTPCFREGKIRRVDEWLGRPGQAPGGLRRQPLLQRLAQRPAAARARAPAGGRGPRPPARRGSRAPRLAGDFPALESPPR